VGARDLPILLGNWNMTFGRQFQGDINGDCTVGEVDL
jgi:hypothetical protein